MSENTAVETNTTVDEARVIWTVNKFPRSVKNQFSAIAKMQGKTITELLEQIVTDYIKQNIDSLLG